MVRRFLHLHAQGFDSMKTSKELFAQLDAAIVDAIMVPRDWLPESMRGKRSHRPLRSAVNESKRRHKKLWVDGRDVPLSFNNKTHALIDPRQERLETVEHYRQSLDESGEIDYRPNDAKLYRHELAWVAAMVNAGVIDSVDAEE